MASDCATPSAVVCPAASTTAIGGELVLLHDAEADARVGLDLLLEVLGELLVALGGDDGQRVHVEAPQPLPLLIHAEPQAAPDGLAAFPLGAHLAQGTNLEDVRVVPALLQRRVGEDELQPGLEAQQLLLLLHDQAVGPLGVVAVALVVLVGIRPAALLVDGEVAVMHVGGGRRHVHLLEQALVVGVLGQAAIFLLEDQRRSRPSRGSRPRRTSDTAPRRR